MIEMELEFRVIGQSGRAVYDLYPISQAAKMMGYHPQTIRRMIDSGELIAHKFSYMWFVHPEKVKSVADLTVHDTS